MGNFLEKTIKSIDMAFEDMFYSETVSQKNCIMMHIDARNKLLNILVFILLINITKSVNFLLIMLLYTIVLAFLSKIPFKKYIFRVCTISILFTGIILIPSIFNIVNNGNVFLHITRNIYITKQGIENSIIIILRSFISLSLLYILLMTTKWPQILRSIRVLKVPKIFSITLEMSMRYIFLFLELAKNMFLARKSRNVGKTKSKENRKFIAASIGHLFVRSVELSNDIYDAMVSRGYTGNYSTLSSFKLTKYDYIWILFNIIFLILSVIYIGGIF